jgi:hypothetical protein
LACDDGTPRLIKLDENDLYMIKQYSKTNGILKMLMQLNKIDKKLFYK